LEVKVLGKGKTTIKFRPTCQLGEAKRKGGLIRFWVRPVLEKGEKKYYSRKAGD